MQDIEARAAATDAGIIDGITIELPAGLSADEKEKMLAEIRDRLVDDVEFQARRERAAAARARFEAQRTEHQRQLYERLKAQFETPPTEGLNPAVD